MAPHGDLDETWAARMRWLGDEALRRICEPGGKSNASAGTASACAGGGSNGAQVVGSDKVCRSGGADGAEGAVGCVNGGGAPSACWLHERSALVFRWPTRSIDALQRPSLVKEVHAGLDNAVHERELWQRPSES